MSDQAPPEPEDDVNQVEVYNRVAKEKRRDRWAERFDDAEEPVEKTRTRLEISVFVYVNTSKQVGDPDHLKVFATAPRRMLGLRNTIRKAWREYWVRG